jgi:hypothetical protein
LVGAGSVDVGVVQMVHLKVVPLGHIVDPIGEKFLAFGDPVEVAGAEVKIVSHKNEPFFQGSHDCDLSPVDVQLDKISRLRSLNVKHPMLLLHCQIAVEFQGREGNDGQIDLELLDEIIVLKEHHAIVVAEDQKNVDVLLLQPTAVQIGFFLGSWRLNVSLLLEYVFVLDFDFEQFYVQRGEENKVLAFGPMV